MIVKVSGVGFMEMRLELFRAIEDREGRWRRIWGGVEVLRIRSAIARLQLLDCNWIERMGPLASLMLVVTGGLLLSYWSNGCAWVTVSIVNIKGLCSRDLELHTVVLIYQERILKLSNNSINECLSQRNVKRAKCSDGRKEWRAFWKSYGDDVIGKRRNDHVPDEDEGMSFFKEGWFSSRRCKEKSPCHYKETSS